jgi:aconitase B
VEFIKAGGSYAIVFGKKTTNICCYNFKYRYTSGIRCVKKRISIEGLTAVEKYSIKTLLGQLRQILQVQMCV